MVVQATEVRRYKHLINRGWVDPDSGETITRTNPATGQSVAEYAAGSPEDTRRAIDAARAAFDRGPWPKMTGAEREMGQTGVEEFTEIKTLLYHLGKRERVFGPAPQVH